VCELIRARSLGASWDRGLGMRPQWWIRSLGAVALAVTLPLWLVASPHVLATPESRARSDTAPQSGTAFVYTADAVNFDLSGLEPDFDPIYKVVVSGALRDTERAGQPLPESTLVLDAYLEVFQPDTTPVLPDLLHPDSVATNLAGFLSGKAALVNEGGTVVYQGSLLAEIFQDNTEHLVVDLSPAGSGASVRLQGEIALVKGGTEHGTLLALSPLARAKLAVPRGKTPSWQQIVSAMSVSKPAMIGTANPAGKRSPSAPTTIAPKTLLAVQTPSASACDILCRVRRPSTLVPLGLGTILAGIGLYLSLSRRLRGTHEG